MKLFIFAIFALLLGCSSEVPAVQKSGPKINKFFYYDSTNKLSQTFDLKDNLMIDRHFDRTPGSDLSSSEFSGPLDSCSSVSFHCFSTGLQLAIPKEKMLVSWNFKYLSCKSNGVYNGDAPEYTILCKNKLGYGATLFRFSFEKGVTQY